MLAAVAVSMGSMIIGFSAAYTSPALVTMENSTTISITKEQVSNYKIFCMSKISQLETIKYVQVRLFIWAILRQNGWTELKYLLQGIFLFYFYSQSTMV